MRYCINSMRKLYWLLWMVTSHTMAADVSVTVTNQSGELLENAVVFFESSKPSLLASPVTIDISQKKKTFHPLVSVIQTGSKVNFPNYDSVRHHVYSFSPVKTFEIKLYKDRPKAPVMFDKAGVVVLGCNIHDNMLAYVLVVDTPFFAKTTEQGVGLVKSLPISDYKLNVWHPSLKQENQPFQQSIMITENKNMTVRLETK